MLNIKENINKLPLITLENLYQITTKKKKMSLQNPSFHKNCGNKNTDLKILSPFYDRSKGHHKESCKCSYHPQKRFKSFVPVKRDPISKKIGDQSKKT